MTSSKSVSIIIPVKNGGSGFAQVLDAIYTQTYDGQLDVVIIDSGSTDGTPALVTRDPARLLQVRPEEFGHGRTRNLGAMASQGEFLVFTTADAVPASDIWLRNLVRNFEDPNVAGVYGRQIPKPSTWPMEDFFLRWRYPPVRKIQYLDGQRPDLDTIFFSNVSSAIRRRVFEAHPFEDVPINEDQVWAKNVVLNGYSIVYDPEAAVYHSHNRPLLKLFRRYFSAGMVFGQMARTEYSTHKFLPAGVKYMVAELQFLLFRGHVRWLPHALIYDACKFAGLWLGRHARWLPRRIKDELTRANY